MIGCAYIVGLLFFLKQQTAYEMRISDWSSDVCSSDLGAVARHRVRADAPASGVAAGCRAAAGAVAAVTVAGVVDRPAARTQGERAVGFAARIPRSPVAAHLGVLRGFRHRRRPLAAAGQHPGTPLADRKSTRLNSSH